MSQTKVKMGLFKTIAINIESFKFSIKLSKKIYQENPLMDPQEIKLRVIVAWAGHLMDTNRQELVYNKPLIERYRAQLALITNFGLSKTLFH